MSKSKLANSLSASPVYDNAVKMLSAFKSRNPNWKSSPLFVNYKCRNRVECSLPCLWLEQINLTHSCALCKNDCHFDSTTGVEFNSMLDYWDKLYVSEEIMNCVIETPLTDYEAQSGEYLNVTEMACESNATNQTIIKHIRQGKLWARRGKIRSKVLTYVSTREDFDNYVAYGLSKGEDPNYPSNVSI